MLRSALADGLALARALSGIGARAHVGAPAHRLRLVATTGAEDRPTTSGHGEAPPGHRTRRHWAGLLAHRGGIRRERP